MAPATDKNTIASPPLHTCRPTIFSIILKDCPFCLAEPDSNRDFHGRAVVYCGNDDCPACPQVTAAAIEDAANLWNHRYHPGFVAPDVRQ